ncbi:MAG: nitrite reductase, copper-containing [Hyphomonadaceae bacterium]|nr:nitrite reductase, copper-containing [Hyphomonadaceae bacterium]
MTQHTEICRRSLFVGAATVASAAPLAFPASASASTANINALERVRVNLVPPPFAHPHEQIARGGPRVVQFRMVIEEKPIVIDAAGTTLRAMTYNGSMPGPLMVVHQDDYVELTLVNPASNEMPHNIDFHASTGALGGGALTNIFPGQEVVLRWKATRPGVFTYHCAPEGMIAWHVVSGMTGAVMVLPRDGLKDHEGRPVSYDKLFYIGENDLYVPRDENGRFKSYDSLGESFADTLEVMKGLIPSHIVFNGAVGSLTGANALTARVGEKVLFVHNSTNRDTRPHLIGGHGDLVWAEGAFNNPPLRDLETWHIVGGSAGAALYTFRQPGLYAYVNHNLIEAEQLGAVAHVRVEGTWNDDLMKQVVAPRAIR